MKKIKYILILIMTLMLTGCYNYKELNELAITTGISIDYDKEKDHFNVLLQVINPLKQQDAVNSGKPNFINYESSSPSLEEAFQLISMSCPKILYGAEMQVLILSENVINEKLETILDYFLRKPELRPEFKVIVARNNYAKEAITIETLLDNLPSSNLVNVLDKQEKLLAITNTPTLNELADMYLNPYKEIVLPSFTVINGTNSKKENSQKNIIKLMPSAIFKDNKLIAYLDETSSKVLNLIKGNLKNTVLTINKDNKSITLEPNKIKTEISSNIKENIININIKGIAKINELDSKLNLRNKNVIEEIENELNKYTEEIILDTFNNIRDKYKTDVFNFRNIYYIENPKYFNDNYKDKWYQDKFNKLSIKVKSNIKLYEKGNILGGVYYEKQNK